MYATPNTHITDIHRVLLEEYLKSNVPGIVPEIKLWNSPLEVNENFIADFLINGKVMIPSTYLNDLDCVWEDI
jgi:hypothetical protein